MVKDMIIKEQYPVIIAGINNKQTGWETTNTPYNQDYFICRMPNGRYAVMAWGMDFARVIWTSKHWPKNIQLLETCTLADPNLYCRLETKTSLRGQTIRI